MKSFDLSWLRREHRRAIERRDGEQREADRIDRLIQSIEDQHRIIAGQQQRIDEFENENSNLESRIADLLNTHIEL